MKKKNTLTIIAIGVIAFILGFSLSYSSQSQKPQSFDSCKAAYENLIHDDLCVGKFEEYWGTDKITNNVEYFDFNWGEDVGDYGIVKEYVGGINRECYEQAQRQYVKAGKRDNLITCFSNEIETLNDILRIQCAQSCY